VVIILPEQAIPSFDGRAIYCDNACRELQEQ
jgi:hypothetical protein